MPPEPLLGPLQPLVDDPACQEVRVARYDRVLVRRRGRVMEVAGIRFADDPAVRRFVEQLTGCSTTTLSSLVHPLPGDALLVAHFPPRSTHVTLSLFRPERREELVA